MFIHLFVQLRCPKKYFFRRISMTRAVATPEIADPKITNTDMKKLMMGFPLSPVPGVVVLVGPVGLVGTVVGVNTLTTKTIVWVAVLFM